MKHEWKQNDIFERRELKQYEINKKRDIVRKRNGGNRESERNERPQKRENVEDTKLGRLFELATTNEIYVNRMNL